MQLLLLLHSGPVFLNNAFIAFSKNSCWWWKCWHHGQDRRKTWPDGCWYNDNDNNIRYIPSWFTDWTQTCGNNYWAYCTKVRSPREVREYVPTYAPTAALSGFIDFPKQSVELPSEWTQTSDWIRTRIMCEPLKTDQLTGRPTHRVSPQSFTTTTIKSS